MSYASMPPPSVCLFRNSLCARLPLSSLLHRHRTPSRWPRFCAVKIGTRGGRIGSQDAYGSDLLRKPIFSPPVKDFTPISVDEEEEEKEEEEEEKEKIERRLRYEQREEEEEFIDWENRILEDTVPLVGFVRMILHSGKYESGDRLIPKHERTILERLLPYHPESEKKIGCGIDYITDLGEFNCQ
ncbi:protein DCL homolog, chloroplastic isoform X2 [Malania oleifera]|uniref:protein DCL homolog, chloroplastic isoform X2 n=1 Tax=Malania oleifera TaxID=397392 RepID=UPI0025AE4850|nr:protein DCL homolog, chloroplastic isoform X2 [Malania oleifera]